MLQEDSTERVLDEQHFRQGQMEHYFQSLEVVSVGKEFKHIHLFHLRRNRAAIFKAEEWCDCRVSQ